MTDAGFSQRRRRRNIIVRLQQVLSHLPSEQQIDVIATWMTVDTMEALVATLEDERKKNELH